jgi:argininosuccinate lyase
VRKKNYSTQKHRKVLQTKSFLIKIKFEFYIHTGNTEVRQMAQLWGGRFTKDTDQLVYNFNASISFDQKFFHQDIEGSIAHTVMLAKQKILTEEEKDAIVKGLTGIREDVDAGKLQITSAYEDIHSFVEANLIDRIGDAGKKLHTGRSRNDQVALDMKLYTRDEISNVDDLLKDLLAELLIIMKENTETYMPGFTHLQKAQPITLAHHMGAYFEMFKRDRSRMADIYKRMNYCPLGSGALAGTTYPLDREYTASLLGFEGPTLNSMDSVADRDYLIEFLSALSTIMMHLSRFSEEIIIWNSNEYKFIEIDDAYSTGSSIMPQKKNPDIAELVRGKTGRVYGALMSLLTTMKGIPLAYNKDMQEDKELTFDAIDTVKGCLALFTGMIRTMKFNKDIMEKSAMHGFTNATDAADYLVKHGVPFRDAHSIIGHLVLTCIEKGKAIDEMSIEELKEISDVFEPDVYDAISLKTCVEKRLTIGAPSKTSMEQAIAAYEAYLKE